MSKGPGIFARIPFIFYLIKVSAETPTPPTSLGSRDNIVEHIVLVSMIAEDISALGCSPNTSVKSFMGRVLMYSKHSP